MQQLHSSSSWNFSRCKQMYLLFDAIHVSMLCIFYNGINVLDVTNVTKVTNVLMSLLNVTINKSVLNKVELCRRRRHNRTKQERSSHSLQSVNPAIPWKKNILDYNEWYRSFWLEGSKKLTLLPWPMVNDHQW